MNVQVLPGDSPSSIAARLTGDPRRGMELVLANPYKRRAAVPGGVTFASLRAGEMLTVPSSWGAVALAGPPRGAKAGVGLTLNADPGSQTLSTANGALSTAQGLLAQLLGGQGTTDAATVMTAFGTAVGGYQNAAAQAQTAANAALAAIAGASSLGTGDPAAITAQNDLNSITGNIGAITADAATVAGIGDPTTTDPTSTAQDAAAQAQAAVNSAIDALSQATNWNGGNQQPTPTPVPSSIPANVVADAQAAANAIAADANYCVSVRQAGSSVNVAVHNFKTSWNAYASANGLAQVPVGTSQFEPSAAQALSAALGGGGPAGCGGGNPIPTQTPAPTPYPTHAPTPVPTAAPAAAATSSMTPWLIAGGIVLVAGIGYLVYRNREHPTVARGLAATRRGATHVGTAARAGARRVGSAARSGYHAVRRRVAAGSTRRRALRA